MTEQQDQKLAAAQRAVEEIRNGMIVGLGTGSTAELAIIELGKRLSSDFQITGVATSKQSAQLATEQGIPLLELQDVDHIDVTIDGADEIQPGTLFALKGAGGALLREKLVALDSARVILIVDSTKIVDLIGSNFSIPVEVVPFGWRIPARGLTALGAEVEIRRDPATQQPFVTDNENLVIDARFGPVGDPNQLSRRIKEITGVIEHGLFIGVIDDVIVGQDGEPEHLTVTARPAD